MIWIDEQQGRLGSPTALSRAPGRPLAIVAPVLPVIKAGPAVSQADLPKTVPARVMAVLEDCEEPGNWNDEPVIARLAQQLLTLPETSQQRRVRELEAIVRRAAPVLAERVLDALRAEVEPLRAQGIEATP